MAAQKKKVILNFTILALLTLVLRLAPLVHLGPLFEPDSDGYIRVARTLAETGQFAILDPVSHQLVPFVTRVPFFHFVAARLINLFGPEVGWPLTIMNVILGTATVVLAGWFFYRLVNLPVGLLTGWLMALNPNSIYNTLLVMPDIFFSFFCLLVFILGAQALSRRSWGWYFAWGVAIGLVMLIKPVFRYYWFIVLIILAVQYRNWKSWGKYAVTLMLGISLVIAPWLIRNHSIFGFWGLELTTGINSIWSITDLIKPSTDQQRLSDPELAKVRDVVVHSRETLRQAHPEKFNDKDIFAQFNYASYAWGEIQAQLGLSIVATDKMLTRLGLEVIRQNPVIVAKRYALNTVNFLNSPASLAELICRLIPGGRMYRQPLSVAWQERNMSIVVPTIMVRIAYLFLLFIAFRGGITWWKNKIDRQVILFLVLSVFYFVLFSFAAGYDRYRLPVDPLLAGLAGIAMTAFYYKNKGKKCS